MTALREIRVKYHQNKDIHLPNGLKVETPDDVADCFAYMQNEAQEKLVCISLSTKNRIMCFEIIGIGTVNTCLAHPREVFRSAILNNAYAIILVHNHPSGEPEPSPDDVALTRIIQQAGNILGIELLDHIIIGDNGRYCSMKALVGIP